MNLRSQMKSTRRNRNNVITDGIVRPLPPFVDDLPVWVQTSGRQIPGQINQPANTSGM